MTAAGRSTGLVGTLANPATLAKQAINPSSIHTYLHNDAPGLGQGVVMLTQYLLWTDPTYDCGLVAPIAQGSTPRPAYTVWKSLPTT